MEFAIIAAGEGSRLQEEGVDMPKPLLPLCGTPMIERLINVFAKSGADQVHVVINKRSTALRDFLDAADFGIPVYMYVHDTASSLHTMGELVKANPLWASCIVTTTDTVFSERDFLDYVADFESKQEADACMGLTTFVDDESPLFVEMDATDRIQQFADAKVESAQYISGGIYGLRRRALDCVQKSIAQGNARMRNYQRFLLTEGLNVQGHVFGKIVDVDHVKDQQMAEAFLREIGEVSY